MLNNGGKEVECVQVNTVAEKVRATKTGIYGKLIWDTSGEQQAKISVEFELKCHFLVKWEKKDSR